MIDAKLTALVSLLDDEDELVWKTAYQELLNLNQIDMNSLFDAFNETNLTELQYQKLNSLKNEIHFKQILNQLIDWKNKDSIHLIKALTIICNIEYQEVTEISLNQEIEKLRLDAWLEFHYDLTSFEKVKIINYILFQLHGFKGDDTNFLKAENSFINKVLENKKGNPISLSIIYLLIAQKLNLPVFGVNLPKHFILTYLESDNEDNLQTFAPNQINYPNSNNAPMFYINPFDGGSVFNAEQLNQVINNLKLENQASYYLPCTNYDIVLRVLKNIFNSYSFYNNPNADFIKEIIEKF